MALAGMVVVLLLSSGPAATGSAPVAPPPPPHSVRAEAVHSAATGSTGGAVAELRVDAADPAIVPYSGVESNLTAYSAPTMPDNSQLQIATAVVLGNYDAVFGIFLNNTIAPVPFFEVFSNSTDQGLRLVYWPSFALDPSTGYLFALVRTAGTVWEFTLDGRPLGGNATTASYDFGLAAGTWARSVSLTEIAAYASTPFAPPSVTATLAFAVLRPNGWYLPHNGTASTSGSIAGPWGLEGMTQHPTLAPGEVESGPTIASLPNGTNVWTGGPVPVRVTLTLGSGLLPAAGSTPLAITVLSSSGLAISMAAVYLTDSMGGLFFPPALVTGPEGNSSSTFIAPNASARETDQIRANSTIFGFAGSAIAAVVVTAAVQVTLDAPSSVRVETSGTVTVDVRAVVANGTPLAGVLVTFSVSGAAGIDPTTTITDGSGEATTVVLAPGAPATVTLIATAVSPGYWGATRVTVQVVAPATVWWGNDIPYVVGGALAILVLVALVMLYRRATRKEQELPPMGRLRLPKPAAPTEPGATEPVSGPGPPAHP